MHVVLFLIFYFSSFQQIPPSGPPTGTQKNTTQPQPDTHKQATQRAETIAPVGTDESHNKGPDDAKQSDEGYDKWLNHSYEWATIIGVVGGWVLLWFIWRQNQAVIRAERAWLMIDIRAPSKNLLVAKGTSNDAPQDHTWVNPVVFCQNQGKTPGWIIEIHIRAEIVYKKDIPPKPDFGKGFQIVKELRPVPVNIEVPRYLPIMIGAVREEGQIVLVYGFVVYRDIFSKRRKTVFGSCVYGTDMLMPVDFAAYHETT
jgi:hypothetical protein